jgi:hypothetical protein
MFTDLPGTLTAIATLIAAISAVVLTWRNAIRARKVQEAAVAAHEAALAAKTIAEASKAEIIAVQGGVYELGKRLDGRLEQLLKLTDAAARASGRAAGILEGREAQKADNHEAEKGGP